MSDKCDENCRQCSGEYCNVHFNDPCECDVIDRHKIIYTPDLQSQLTDLQSKLDKAREALEKKATALEVRAILWHPGANANLNNPYARQIFDELRNTAVAVRLAAKTLD